MESSPTPEPAAEAGSPPSPAAASGIKSWLPLLVTLLVMPLLAYGMTQFVLLPKLQKGLGITPVTTAEPKEHAKTQRESVPMNKLLVNVAGTLGARYLLVSVSISGSDAQFKTKMADHDPQLRDLACGVLSAKTLADLERPDVRNVIRTELISGFNNILGGPIVQEIFLTEFAIQ